jgi:catechol 2,3-dioxygenase-like lactoylglutathione lyase family enzyme
MPTTDSRTALTRVAVTMIPVTDQDAAVDFYVDKLGLEKRVDVPLGDTMRWIEVAPAGAPTRIALCPPGEQFPVGLNTGVSLHSDDIDADHATLRERGVDVDPEVSRMGGPVPPMFWFRDQDGNTLLVVQDEA